MELQSESNIKVLENLDILNNKLTIYSSILGEELFLADDVAKVIENKNVSQMLKNIDEEEKVKITFVRSNGGTIQKWYLSEDGLYEVLMQSRSPKAKEFKKEIKKILKEIRRKGVYISIRQNDTLETITERFNKVFEGIKKELELKDNKIKNFENFLREGKDEVSISFLATKYNMTKKEFMEKMKELKFMYYKGDKIYLYSQYKFKKYAKYYKRGEKNIIKFTLLGQAKIDELIDRS